MREKNIGVVKTVISEAAKFLYKSHFSAAVKKMASCLVIPKIQNKYAT